MEREMDAIRGPAASATIMMMGGAVFPATSTQPL
eukprot:gene48825-6018_t